MWLPYDIYHSVIIMLVKINIRSTSLINLIPLLTFEFPLDLLPCASIYIILLWFSFSFEIISFDLGSRFRLPQNSGSPLLDRVPLGQGPFPNKFGLPSLFWYWLDEAWNRRWWRFLGHVAPLVIVFLLRGLPAPTARGAHDHILNLRHQLNQNLNLGSKF